MNILQQLPAEERPMIRESLFDTYAKLPEIEQRRLELVITHFRDSANKKAKDKGLAGDMTWNEAREIVGEFYIALKMRNKVKHEE